VVLTLKLDVLHGLSLLVSVDRLGVDPFGRFFSI
jgi:hypothetical protein